MTTQPTTTANASPWPHRMALLLVALTFFMVCVGGLVTTMKAGMAVPDWPNTYGHFMWFYPWADWLKGPWNLFVEHAHRLLGIVVGLATIGLLASLFVAEHRRWVRVLGGIALVAVIGQGALGGMRVLLDHRFLAAIHGCVGPAFLAFACVLAVVTSKAWRSTQPVELAQPNAILLPTCFLACMSYVQILLGAGVRHIGPMATPQQFQATVVMHVAIGIALAAYAVFVAWRVHRSRIVGRLKHLSRVTTAAVLLQIVLGLSTWLLKYGPSRWFSESDRFADWLTLAASQTQAMLPTLHVACGALILSLAVTQALWALRLLRPALAAAAFGQTNQESRNTRNDHAASNRVLCTV